MPCCRCHPPGACAAPVGEGVCPAFIVVIIHRGGRRCPAARRDGVGLLRQAVEAVVEHIDRHAAPADAAVILLGESGSPAHRTHTSISPCQGRPCDLPARQVVGQRGPRPAVGGNHQPVRRVIGVAHPRTCWRDHLLDPPPGVAPGEGAVPIGIGHARLGVEQRRS